MPPFVFAGFPAYLESAAGELGAIESVAGARRIVPLTALANLCAQAVHGDQAHVAGILAKAREFRSELAVAIRAADLMLADVEACRTAPPTIPVASPELRGVRKGPRSLRELS